jgi:hypothetical protein
MTEADGLLEILGVAGDFRRRNTPKSGGRAAFALRSDRAAAQQAMLVPHFLIFFGAIIRILAAPTVSH